MVLYDNLVLLLNGNENFIIFKLLYHFINTTLGLVL
jgi:hypothetical protein